MDRLAFSWRSAGRLIDGRIWRRFAAILALFGLVTLLAHEGQHYIHADDPDSCPFAYVANSVPPAPPAIVLPARQPVAELVAWSLPATDLFSSCTDKHRTARGPPTL